MKRTYGENKEIGINVTSRLPESLIKRADEYRIKNNIESRSGLIGEALEEYITSQKCPQCGAHNPYNGNRCSVCGENIGELRNTIANIKTVLIQIEDLMPVIRQKYNMCLTTIKALKITDIFLLRRFDLITAKILRNNKEDTPEYFLDPPKWQPTEFAEKENYAEYQGFIKFKLETDREIVEALETNKNATTLEEILSEGYTRIEMARTIYHTLSNFKENYKDISAELDMISEYLTEEGNKGEKVKKEGTK